MTDTPRTAEEPVFLLREEMQAIIDAQARTIAALTTRAEQAEAEWRACEETLAEQTEVMEDQYHTLEARVAELTAALGNFSRMYNALRATMNEFPDYPYAWEEWLDATDVADEKARAAMEGQR